MRTEGGPCSLTGVGRRVDQRITNGTETFIAAAVILFVAFNPGRLACSSTRDHAIAHPEIRQPGLPDHIERISEA